MNRISNEYGKWLSSFDWTHFFTVRRHFPLTEFQADKMAQKLIKSPYHILRMFYSLEKDRQDSMTHIHFIVEAGLQDLTRKETAKGLGLGKSTGDIGDFQEVDSNVGVSYYTSKFIGTSSKAHGYYDKKLLESADYFAPSFITITDI